MTHLVYADSGEIRGFNISYNSTTAVNTPGGFCRANGKEYFSASAATHTMTSLAAGFDHHYIYIDDTASTAPVATIIDATTEPTWSDTKNGWYNGDDRCIGQVESTVGAATIIVFSTKMVSDKYIEVSVANNAFPSMAENFNPTSAWMTPTIDGDANLPVTAIAFRGRMKCGETGAGSPSMSLTSKENADAETTYNLGDVYIVTTAGASLALLPDDLWINLGASRQVRLGGTNANDNVLGLWAKGYGYSR